MFKFKVGDKVRIISKQGEAPYGGAWERIKSLNRDYGYIIEVEPNYYIVDYFPDSNRGDFYDESDLQLIESADSKKGTIMSKLTSMFKVLVDKDTQVLKKAGFINGDLELTSEGQSALNAVLFNANKAELVKLAQEMLDEEKE